MLVLTTIYFAESARLTNNDAPEADAVFESNMEESQELVRELLCLYEGKNRVLPIDQ